MKMLLFLLMFTCSPLAFCNIDNAVSVREGSEVIKMRIQSEKVACDGYDNNTTCYVVQKESSIGKDNWEVLEQPIDGFNFEPGYIYDVTVKIERVDNPGPDQSEFRYILVNVISKQASE